MQHADQQVKLILICIGTRAGHGQGKPTMQQLNETAEVYTLMIDVTGP
jgi:prolyl oligopeptidase PreP (S9A serine peptidase family)